MTGFLILRWNRLIWWPVRVWETKAEADADLSRLALEHPGTTYRVVPFTNGEFR